MAINSGERSHINNKNHFTIRTSANFSVSGTSPVIPVMVSPLALFISSNSGRDKYVATIRQTLLVSAVPMSVLTELRKRA